MDCATSPSLRCSQPEAAGQAEFVGERRLEFAARDGFLLRGTLYLREDATCPTDVVVFNPGCGLRHSRFREFLRFLAREGIPVLAYDYRGVGISTTSRQFDAGIEDWIELDQAAAIQLALTRFPQARISSVSHSIGCFVAAAAPNASRLAQMVFVAPHTGFWRDYRSPWRWPMALVWHVLSPALARLLGYFPATRLGLGDNFPKRVALQWASRTQQHYDFRKFGSSASRIFEATERMRQLSGTALVITIDDDCFATDRAARRFMRGLPGVRLVRRDLALRSRGRAGHLGFFRRRHSENWSIVAEFVRNRPSLPQLHPEWKDA